MYYITSTDHVKIAVYDKNPLGSKTVFFVHGWPLSHKIFEYQEEGLLSCNYRIISIDLRGFGDSDAPACPYDYNTMADDIYAVVKCLKLNSFILAGFSMGGAIVSRYMARYHGYGVSKLALFAAAAPSFTQRPGFSCGVTRESVDELIALARTDRPQFCRDFSKKLLYSPHSDAVKEWFEGIALEADGVATIATGYALRDEDGRNDMRHIKVPTGIFFGTKDEIVPYELGLVQQKMIAKSMLFTFENSGHGIFYDELEAFNNTMIQFFNEI